jgi:hypothetical protein
VQYPQVLHLAISPSRLQLDELPPDSLAILGGMLCADEQRWHALQTDGPIPIPYDGVLTHA